MTAKQRLFVGIALPEEARATLLSHIDAQRESLGRVPSLRMIAPEQWHLTLQFLGGVAEDLIPSVHEACKRAAATCAPFELELKGTGAFRSSRAATVLWIGTGRGSPELAILAHHVMAHCEPLGFPPERRPYSCHLTVARLKHPADLRAPLESLHIPPIAVPIVELTLFRSHLSSTGARYTPLAHYHLGPPGAR
jgi:2'-5' RNA ligase